MERIVSSSGNKKIKFEILFNACHWRIRTTPSFKEEIFQMIQSDRGHYTLGLLFLGIFQVEGAEKFLIDLLEQEDPVYIPLAFYSLFLMDHQNYFNFFHFIEQRYQYLKTTLLDYIESKKPIMDRKIYGYSLYLGDQRILDLYEKIEEHQIINEDYFEYKRHERDLKWKTIRLKEVAQKKNTPT